MFQIFLKIHLNAYIVQLSLKYIFQFPIVESTEDVFKVQKVRQDLIDPEAFEEIKNGKWTCKRLRELILHMVLPETAFKGK
jgi:ethanolamine ammonia-lyase large subunit